MTRARSSCIIEFYESYGSDASPPAAAVISAARYLLHAFIRVADPRQKIVPENCRKTCVSDMPRTV